jgi:PAS domain S-box-containing protein
MISVLYVDDESALLDIVKIYLEKTGKFEVQTACSAREALEKLQNSWFDVVVADYQMQDMNGIDFLVELRKDYPVLPFIIFTGKGREEVVIEAFEKGADFYLQKGGAPKPQFAELRRKIEMAVERRRAETTLRESEERFRSMFERNDAVMILISADDGRIIGANAAASRFYGYSHETLLQMSISQINQLPADQITRVIQEILFEKQKFFIFPHRISSGEIRTVEVHSTPIEVDKRPALLSIIHDITGRKQAEDALQESETRFRSLVEHIQDGILIISSDGMFLFSNPAALELVGLCESDLKTGIHISTFVDPDSLGKALADIQTIFDGHSPLVGEYQIRTVSGDTRWVEAASTRITYQGRDADLVTLRDITRRRDNEKDLQKAKTWLQCIIDSVPEPVFVKDRQHRWIIFNDAACRIVGHSREELLGKTDDDFFPEEEARVFRERDEIVFLTGVDDVNEQYLTDAKGNRHAILTKKRRIMGESGEQFIIGVSTDITERKRIEEALRQSEERYRRVVEDQTEFICRFTPDGTHVFVNEEYCRYFGKTRSGIIGSRFIPAIPAEDRPAIRSHFASLTLDHPVASIDHRIVMPGGEVRWQRWSDRAIFNTSGAIVEYQSVGRDITDRKQDMDMLRESEQRFRSLFDNLIEGMALHEVIYDDQGEPTDYRILEVNTAYEKVLGIPRDRVIGKSSRDAYGTDVPPYLEIYSRVERTGISESFETYYEPMRKHFIISVYSPKKGQFVTVFENVTQRKQTEDALREANKKLNLMSSITRHDILNQLLVLRGFLELSREYVRDPQNMKTCIEKEEAAALQIQHQITFTRDYQNMGVKEPVWQPVREIIGNVVKILPMGTVQVEVTCGDLEIFTDQLLEKVFYNLIENALRHGGMEMTVIRISSHASGSGITLVVEDDGIGICREDKKHLFERGFGKHSGLGLFLSREILSITGITITETGVPGKGARFEIEVPHEGYRYTGADAGR